MLADDDEDDCIFFREVLKELPVLTELTTVSSGEQLMQLLSKSESGFPDVLFLDLNMPRKSGIECLSEIKHNEKLKHIPVIIYSTSLDLNVANLLYENGADYYVRKLGDYSKLRKVIHKALTMADHSGNTQPPKEKFIISV